ncbi:t SNARE [Geosmithia morbida]|uniref:T SNARE n=1 Tax=Geosmithia morbida TaxID=1094350 RepID=A0A9P5D372_9HYPO|nr:t SNARE [Geosmithia morbida]KAF4125883.1 t SNARE [Geosmithia morbida]
MAGYDQLSNLESGDGDGAGRSGGGGGGGYSDDPAFRDLQYDLKGKLQSLLSNNRKLASDVNVLGTKKDTPRLRERVHNTMVKNRSVCQEIGEGVKKLQTWEELSRYEQTKVSSDFQAALQEFQALQRRALDKEKASINAARASTGADLGEELTPTGGGSSGQQEQLLQRQEMAPSAMAAQDEVDFQESLIIEREEEIRNIEQGVGDLNVLFRQVAQIVNEQGEQLTSIEDNVYNVRDDTRQADVENRQAARYQKAARNKGCCLLLIMAVILTIVILAIVVG